mgnify:CR=1 FL=1
MTAMVLTVADVVRNVKHDVIDSFKEIVRKLEAGHQPEGYQCILNKIAFVQYFDRYKMLNAVYECLKS